MFYRILRDVQPSPPHNVDTDLSATSQPSAAALVCYGLGFLPSLYGAEGAVSGRAFAANVTAESVSNTVFSSLWRGRKLYVHRILGSGLALHCWRFAWSSHLKYLSFLVKEIHILSLFSLVRQNAKRKEKIILPYSSLGHSCYGVEGMVVVGVRQLATLHPQIHSQEQPMMTTDAWRILSFWDYSRQIGATHI